MSISLSKKIKYGEACQISEAIADKAFEHLLPQAEQAFASVFQQAFNKIMQSFDINLMIRCGIIEKESSNVGIRILPSAVFDNDDMDDDDCDDEEKEKPGDKVQYVIQIPYSFSYGYRNRILRLNDDTFLALAKQKAAIFYPLRIKHAALKETLHGQVIGKTVRQVIKSWPEAESIIRNAVGIEENPMTVPLELLLAKFLPALSAPTKGENE